MRLGGLDHTDRPRVFLLSTTHGAETHALMAAMATMNVYRQEPVIEHLLRQGERLRQGLDQSISRHGLTNYVAVLGKSCCLSYRTLGPDLQPSQAFRSLLLQETIKRGVLMPSLIVSYAHDDDDIDYTIRAVDAALDVYVRAISDGVEKHLVGRPSQVVSRAFNSS
jgi:glutamate-1-semialdehyde 2,1-aminomutase